MENQSNDQVNELLENLSDADLVEVINELISSTFETSKKSKELTLKDKTLLLCQDLLSITVHGIEDFLKENDLQDVKNVLFEVVKNNRKGGYQTTEEAEILENFLVLIDNILIIKKTM